MSRGPSMTALLGMLAVAGYQNREKIAEWIGGMTGGSGGTPAAAPSGQALDRPRGLDQVLGGMRGQDPGSFLGGALGGLLEQFKQAGQGSAAQSWIESGPNQPIAPPDLAQAIGPETLDALTRQTGLSRDEILSRLSRELPAAVDRYTPDGRMPA